MDRVNLTINLWLSNQTPDWFISIRANYIDGDWELHKKMLNFRCSTLDDDTVEVMYDVCECGK